jgi:spermidine/putrescine transport system permease protein
VTIKSRVHKVIPSVRQSAPQGEAARHARRAYKRHLSLSQTVFIAALIFLFLPLLVLILYSFNDSSNMSWSGFSLRWYRRLIDSRELWRAFRNSIIVAVTSAATATVIGTLGAIGVNWYRYRLRNYIQIISFLPMVLPEIIIGVSLSIFFAGIRLPLGILTIYIAHTTFNLPFVFLMVMARLDEFDFSIIEAAHDLGANELQTLFRVTVPICLPGIISGL